MIKLLGILILIFIEAILIMSIIAYYNHKLDLKDNEISERDKIFVELMKKIRNKNLEIRELKKKIEELECELKGKNNKRLR